MTKVTIGMVLVASLALSSCLTTCRDFPVEKIGTKPSETKTGSARYNVKRFNILEFGGYDALRTEFAKNSSFATTEEVPEVSANGTYVEVTTKWKLPSTPSLIFGYISAATLTVVPMWSTKRRLHRGVRCVSGWQETEVVQL